MTSKEIAIFRLFNQQIAKTNFKKAKDLVSWMGAMQSQDYNMSKWAVGIRLEKATDKDIVSALNKGEIIRTHLLRPTWHLVSSDDIYWLLELTAPYIKKTMNFRHKQLELTDSILKKTYKITEQALSGDNHLTRNELMDLFQKAKIPLDNPRVAHIMLRAELDGLICSGTLKGKQQTYALLEKRVPNKKTLTKDDALSRLALTYFTSHGPASLQDFSWWSGLPVTESKRALAIVKDQLVSLTIGVQEYFYCKNTKLPDPKNDSLYFLPAFDEFIISYKDRSHSLALEHNSKSISNNGIFWPVIVKNGQVIGTWSKEVKKDKVTIQTEYFPNMELRSKAIKKELINYGMFLNKEIEI